MNKLTSALISASLLTAASSAVMAHQQGDWIVRAGAASVQPDDSSSTISIEGTSVAGTSVSVENNTQVGLTIVYMLNNNVGIELLASTPFEHDIKAKGLGAFGVDDLGSTKHLPPTLSVQYYFGNPSSQIRPYVGAGINYTIFFSESLTGEAKSNLGASNLSLDNSVGLALHAGIDYQINDQWLVNASVWNMDIETEATLNTALGKASVDVDIDPWAYILSVGYKF